jgi:hypothetical protein
MMQNFSTRGERGSADVPSGEGEARVTRIFRRFFDLIEKIEGRKRRIETKSAPRPEARITRLDGRFPRR